PYADKFYEMLGSLASGADSSVHPLLEVREEIKTTLIVLVTSDRGLCGSFNGSLISMALKLAKEKAAQGKTVKFVCMGKKARDAVRKSPYEIVAAFADQMGSFDYSVALKLGMEIISGYIKGDFDEVELVFGKFISIPRQEPTTLTLLPMAADGETPAETAGPKQEYLYEPSVEGLLAELLPRFVNVQIYRGMLDTSASEHAARMRAMDNATRNCDDMVGTLTLVYNKARQASITKELMDIVGGTEALKG
ncbi:MAG: ATP synthase F1 subunit gamma, partial [Acidobacteriota bacterium]